MYLENNDVNIFRSFPDKPPAYDQEHIVVTTRPIPSILRRLQDLNTMHGSLVN